MRPPVRLCPAGVVQTVAHLARLHALSERLDTRMARELANDGLAAADCVPAWIAVGEPAVRAQQVQLVLGVGRALDVCTRKPLLRGMVHMIRGPAQLAGLADLQALLECGFYTFKSIKGAQTFL